MSYQPATQNPARRPWGGLTSLVDLHREMNRFFDDLFFNGGALLASPFAFAQNAVTAQLDVHEKDDEICIHADMPGIPPEDLELRLDGDMLTISGERRVEEPASPGFQLTERSVGRIQRSVRLPFEPDADRVRANFEHGVVTIHVPRAATQQRSRRIEVQRGPDGQSSSTSQSSSQSSPSSGGGAGSSFTATPDTHGDKTGGSVHSAPESGEKQEPSSGTQAPGGGKHKHGH
ncbi:MAG TPA: Hsp20/alpha crystallin family protein [Burkholderiaceae bacterium]